MSRTRATDERSVGGTLETVEHWLVIRESWTPRPSTAHPFLRSVHDVEAGGCGRGNRPGPGQADRVDTLLGPEKTGPAALLLGDLLVPWVGGFGSFFLGVSGLSEAALVVGWVMGCWLLFENCTVDASIS